MSSEFWLTRAGRVRATNRALNAAAAQRKFGPKGLDRSDPSCARWEAALEDFRDALRAIYSPEFWESYERLKAGDVGVADYLIDFLEADPICRRSGYLKADLLRFVGRVPLSAEQAERLQAVVLDVTARRYGREFRRYCGLARKLDAPAFRGKLGDLLKSNDAHVRRRAAWVAHAMDRKLRNPPI